MREVVLDVETTGLNQKNDVVGDHRIVEVGCVEIIDGVITGKEFHKVINPNRSIDARATRVHGHTDSSVFEKPRFENIATDLLSFLENSILVIHNAPFDTAFLNSEFKRLPKEIQPRRVFLVTDTLQIARKKFPNQRNDLNSLKRRYNVDISREVHGALTDARILSVVYNHYLRY